MKPTRIAFTMSRDGTITHVIDAAGFDEHLRKGDLLLDLIPDNARAKARSFITALVTDEHAFRWELPLQLGDAELSLEFSGIASPELVVIAMEPQQNPDMFLDGLMEINNEQANAIRSLTRQLARVTSRPDDSLMEMSKLNNELASAQRELARRNAQLRRLNDEKNRILGMVAHDLRNPIGVVAMYAKLLSRGKFGELNEKQEDVLGRMAKNCDWMLSMVEELVDLTAIESGTVTLNQEPVDLADLARECLEFATPLAEQKGITLAIAVEPAPASADSGKLLQVITNLLTNAIKYSESGSTTTIACGTEGAEAWLAVTDEGQGISSDRLDVLFQPFSTVGSRATGGEKSTGLGLAIARRIVEAHDGRMSVSTAVGEGSTFRLHLPGSTRR